MLLFSIIFLQFSNIFVIVLSECNVNIKDDLAKEAPVFLKPTGELLSSLKWKTGEENNILCSGPSNSLIKDDAKEMILKCQANNKFLLNGKNTDIKKLECSKPNTATVINTKKNCLNGGTLHQIGFETTSSSSKSGFINYIDVCYNLNKASVVYTHHIIPGKSIDESASESNRPTFSTKGIEKIIKPNTSYKKSAQEERFNELLGSKMASKYISSTSYLARGHLTPDNDGIFRSWKAATYFYINVAPQWQSVNGQNWVRVENLARKKAALLQDDLEIYTGNFGILSLENNKGEQIEMTLENDGKLIVPKYYWKILKYKNTAIAFITLNNPFATNEKDLCNDICEKYQWPNTDFNLYTKGKTYCCTVKDLLKIFKDGVPIEATNVKSVMSY